MQASERESDRFYGVKFVWGCYACCFLWCLMAGTMTSINGRKFGPTGIIEWTIGLAASTVFGALVCEPLKILVSVGYGYADAMFKIGDVYRKYCSHRCGTCQW